MKATTLVVFSILSVSPLALLQGQRPEQPIAVVQGRGTPEFELDRRLLDIAGRKSLPGFAVALVHKDKVLFQKGYGLADIDRKTAYTPQSLQNIGSISKTLIGISLMQLVEDDKIKLDDEISNYLPFKIVNPYFPEVPITIRQLANHTSSLKDTDDYRRSYILSDNLIFKKEQTGRYDNSLKVIANNKRIPMDEFIKNVTTPKGAWYSKSNFIKQRPGAAFEYSNLGAAVAAYIVERVTGKSFAEYTEEHILKPIGMTHSGWSLDKVDMDRHVSQYQTNMKIVPSYSLITYPEGGLITSVEDMSRYLMEMIKGFHGETKLLRSESFREMTRPQSSGRITRVGQYKYGIFWMLFDESSFGHSGGDPGITTLMVLDPVKNTGTILFTNYLVTGGENSREFLDAWSAVVAYGDANK